MTGLSKVVQLEFGDTYVEVSSGVDGSLEALAAEVVAKLELHPDSFSIFDDCGKVGDAMALQRAFDMAGDSPCVLEVREAPVWKKMREMEAKMNVLVARCPVVDKVLLGIEERSEKRFDTLVSALQMVHEDAGGLGAVAELRQSLEELEIKVNQSIAPLLQSVAIQEMELKAKLDSLDVSLFSKELDAKVNNGIAPMLQSMALQQMDLKDQLESLQSSPSCRSCEKLSDSMQAYTVKVDEVDEVTKNLQKEMDMSSDNIQQTRAQLQALKEEVYNLAEHPASGEIISAIRQDFCKSPKIVKNGLGGDGDFYAQWIEGSANEVSSPFAYSKKSYMGMTNSLNNGGAAPVPFARFAAPRQFERLHGSRSLPHLPPVR